MNATIAKNLNIKDIKNKTLETMATHIEPSAAAGIAGTAIALSFLINPISAILVTSTAAAGLYLHHENHRRHMWKLERSYLKLKRERDRLREKKRHVKAPTKKKNSNDEEIIGGLKALAKNSRRYQNIILSDDIIVDHNDFHDDDRSLVYIKSGISKKATPNAQQKKDSAQTRKKINYPDNLIKELLESALKQDNILIIKTPILDISKKQAKSYKLSLNIRSLNGIIVYEEDYIHVVERYNMQSKITNKLLNYVIDTIKNDKNSDINYIIPITAEMLSNKNFVGDLITFLKSHPNEASKIKLSMSYDTFNNLKPHELDIMRAMAAHKCRYMLTNISTYDLDTELFHKVGVKSASVSAKFIASEMAAHDGFSQVITLRRRLESQAIHFIIEGIDDQDIMERTKRLSARYATGSFFTSSEKMPSVFRAQS